MKITQTFRGVEINGTGTLTLTKNTNGLTLKDDRIQGPLTPPMKVNITGLHICGVLPDFGSKVKLSWTALKYIWTK